MRLPWVGPGLGVVVAAVVLVGRPFEIAYTVPARPTSTTRIAAAIKSGRRARGDERGALAAAGAVAVGATSGGTASAGAGMGAAAAGSATVASSACTKAPQVGKRSAGSFESARSSARSMAVERDGLAPRGSGSGDCI